MNRKSSEIKVTKLDLIIALGCFFVSYILSKVEPGNTTKPFDNLSAWCYRGIQLTPFAVGVMIFTMKAMELKMRMNQVNAIKKENKKELHERDKFSALSQKKKMEEKKKNEESAKKETHIAIPYRPNLPSETATRVVRGKQRILDGSPNLKRRSRV